MEFIKTIILFVGAVSTLTLPLMWFILLLYGCFEKLVHSVDKKEISNKELEKLFMKVAFVLSLIVSSIAAYYFWA